jgi:hypothetical protein
MRNLAVALALLVVTAMPAVAQHIPHGARDFFAPEQKLPPRVTPFAPNPADIYYEKSTTQVFPDLPPEQ